LLQGALRYAWRLVQEKRFRLRAMERTRVIVFGAGAGGMQAVHAMLRDEGSPYLPVALIDDNPNKWSLSIMGVKVVGGRPALSDAVIRYGADALLVAVPSADAALVRDLIDVAGAARPRGSALLPSVRELLGGQVHVADIREPNERDFLGPSPGRYRPRRDLALRQGSGRRDHRCGRGRSAPSSAARSPRSNRPS